jgi:hypothetical protein
MEIEKRLNIDFQPRYIHILAGDFTRHTPRLAFSMITVLACKGLEVPTSRSSVADGKNPAAIGGPEALALVSPNGYITLSGSAERRSDCMRVWEREVTSAIRRGLPLKCDVAWI